MTQTAVCPICYQDFVKKANNQVYCVECRANQLPKIEKYREKIREGRIQRSGKCTSVDEILAEKREYNLKHDTDYSYGQYVMKKEHGWLKED